VLGEQQVIEGWEKGVATMLEGEEAVLALTPAYGYGEEGAPPKIPPGAALDFRVELLGWESTTDISEEQDGSLRRHVTRPGEGWDKPKGRDEVVVSYTARLRGSGETVAGEEDATFALADGCFCPALGRTVENMLVGEQCRVEADARHCFGDAGGAGGKVPPGSALEITVSLRRVHPVDDLMLPGAGLSRKTMKPGVGHDRAGEEARARVLCSVAVDGAPLDDSHAAVPLEFLTDSNEVMEALDLAAVRMRAGEVAVVTVDAAFDWAGRRTTPGGAEVPEGRAAELRIEMLGFDKDKQPWEVEEHEVVAWAREKKERGNALFKAGDYARALKRYRKGLEGLETAESSEVDGGGSAGMELKVALLLNVAAVCLRRRDGSKDLHDAVAACGRALRLAPASAKALFRKAQAHHALGDLEQAATDLRAGILANPGSPDLPALQTQLRSVQGAQRDADRRQRGIYAKMLA